MTRPVTYFCTHSHTQRYLVIVATPRYFTHPATPSLCQLKASRLDVHVSNFNLKSLREATPLAIGGKTSRLYSGKVGDTQAMPGRRDRWTQTEAMKVQEEGSVIISLCNITLPLTLPSAFKAPNSRSLLFLRCYHPPISPVYFYLHIFVLI